MILNVNPTRMELINLKNKLIMARRGHKLLKDKLDELVRVFMELIESIKYHRTIVNNDLKLAISSNVLTRSLSFNEILSCAYNIPLKNFELKSEVSHLVGIKVLDYTIFFNKNNFTNKGSQFQLFHLAKEFKNMINAHEHLLKSMVKLAEIESKVNILGSEIEKTRRRVNALEYTMIPNILETIKYITNKIEETDRGTLVRIMKVKDIVRSK